VGSDVPQIGEPNGHSLKEESLTAYEIGYTGTFKNRTTVGLAYYINDTEDNINFITDLCRKRYTAANPPPGWPLPPVVLELLFQTRGVCLPAEFTYSNLGKLRNKGFEASIDHSFNRSLSAFANYSWQDDPEAKDNNTPAAEIGPASASPVQRRRDRQPAAVPGQPVRQLCVEGVLDGRPRRLLRRRHRLLYDGERNGRLEVAGRQADDGAQGHEHPQRRQLRRRDPAAQLRGHHHAHVVAEARFRF
jgi:outer membrane receptor protein involved in Fe transport